MNFLCGRILRDRRLQAKNTIMRWTATRMFLQNYHCKNTSGSSKGAEDGEFAVSEPEGAEEEMEAWAGPMMAWASSASRLGEREVNEASSSEDDDDY
jgi:hypothetical protein